jgi:branched-chain amino acid transport system permease protein
VITIGTVIVNGLLLSAIYVLLALGLALIYGIVKILSFVHGELLLWGAYATIVLTGTFHLHFLLALPLAAAFSALLAVILERVAFRFTLDRPNTAIAISIGLIGISQTFANVIFTGTPRTALNPFPGSLLIGQVAMPYQRLDAVMATAVLLGVLGWILYGTGIGRALRAMNQNLLAAELMGIDRRQLVILTFAISGFLAGVAGAFWATLFAVTPFAGFDPLFKAFVITVIGGLGSLRGAVVGALVLGLAESISTQVFGGSWVDLASFLLMAAILILRPHGIFGRPTAGLRH